MTIFTGSCVLTAAAASALESAAHRAVSRTSQFADCDDLLAALVDMPDGEAAQAVRILGRASLALRPSAGTGSSNTRPADARTSAAASVAANRALQQAIELAADGPAITTGSLLLGLARVERSSAAAWLRRASLSEVDVVRALAKCQPELALDSAQPPRG